MKKKNNEKFSKIQKKLVDLTKSKKNEQFIKKPATSEFASDSDEYFNA